LQSISPFLYQLSKLHFYWRTTKPLHTNSNNKILPLLNMKIYLCSLLFNLIVLATYKIEIKTKKKIWKLFISCFPWTINYLWTHATANIESPPKLIHYSSLWPPNIHLLLRKHDIFLLSFFLLYIPMNLSLLLTQSSDTVFTSINLFILLSIQTNFTYFPQYIFNGTFNSPLLTCSSS